MTPERAPEADVVLLAALWIVALCWCAAVWGAVALLLDRVL
jgi:hypothetical protein